MPNQSPDYASAALQALAIELDAISGLKPLVVSREFASACQMLHACRGKIAVIGIGKSGHIGRKISATLASVGFPAFFVHAAEALHGDLGMLRGDDLALLLSYSGSSDEITNLLPALRDLGLPSIAITGSPNSQLAKSSSVHLCLHIEREACPHNLAPTASTTATLVLGDMLAMALLKVSGNTSEDFARSHPAGRLGKRLRLRVTDLMQKNDLPLIQGDATVLNTLLTMSEGGLGIAGITDATGKLRGVFTDGDLRRTLQTGGDSLEAPIAQVMNKNFFTLAPHTRLVDALDAFERRKISVAPVVQEERMVGALHMHSILQSGI